MKLKSIGERVLTFHERIRDSYPELFRIGIAIYQPEHDLLHTFASSTVGGSPFDHYEAKLSEIPSLARLKASGSARVIEDFSVFENSTAPHTRRLLESGVASSYTVPMFNGEDFRGFIFFDAEVAEYFTDSVLQYISLYGQLITALVNNDLNSIRTLKGAVMTAREFSRFHDEETAGHLSRMAHYCREIALHLADDKGLDDEYIEFLFQYSPLHDIGKVAVPDRILRSPKRLHGEDLEFMRSHVQKGVEIVDTLIREFGFGSTHHIRILRNLVATHHENVDGSGYPTGLRGEDIPLEGRIAAVADVFDALTSVRPYKQAWEVSRALGYLQQHAGTRFDRACVDAIASRAESFEKIRARYREDCY